MIGLLYDNKLIYIKLAILYKGYYVNFRKD